ncbi:1-(5-phosphoribosyl)-5-[(5-phosphoribosylamino)methylideneamino]imidazole-4-carboxamide isomerase [Candidatus Bathyarchaeota archaeon]|nr:1-(5-phosphoribosyl)-5-[(5-phosphoribosylamino)methylideneamino]imidazole-4-carboxamide isomerase [Candidatus Bathyarchaeota archaeon]
MIIIPAIDIMDGKVVRLSQGNPNLKTEYEQFGDPVSVALKWEEQGAKYLHIVDLDAALGIRNNEEILEKIVKSVNIPIQFGGGIRSFESSKKIFEMGVQRIIIGSLAVTNRKVLTKILDEYGPNKVIVSIDHLNGFIKIKGWKESTKLKIEEFMKELKICGIELFLLTSIDKDGTLSEPDFHGLEKGLKMGKIIAAGGISKIEDLIELKKMGVYAAILGKALYENKFTLNQAQNFEVKKC